MRFASLETVRVAAAAALRRFPLPLLCAWAAGAVAAALILSGGEHPRLFAGAMALTLGIPLALAFALLSERADAGVPMAFRPPRALLAALLLLAMAGVTWLWPQWSNGIQWRRYAQMSLFAHALVAFLPYGSAREPNGFWQYNRTLLERFILASIFSGVLASGLQGALASLKPLFAITVSGKAYALVATGIYFVFHPWYFLAGVPRELAALEHRRDYPGVLRVFAQFILLPLVAVYQVLLTAYLVRVVLTGQWPSGLIGWLVSAEATAGVLVLLLIHPVREQAENLWVRTFARGFYLALLPSLAMLALSIAKRIGQYGVTEDRYFVVVLSAWLAAISLYFIARRDGDIRWIPITLAALALLTLAGPWGAYHVSFASQRTRLVRLLDANGMFEHGRARRATHPVPFAARKQLSSVLTYLLDTHRGGALRPLLGGALAAADSGLAAPELVGGGQRAQRVLDRLGLVYVNSWEGAQAEQGSFTFMVPYDRTRAAAPLEGLDYHVRVDGGRVAFDADGRHLTLSIDDAGRRLVLCESPPAGGSRPVARADTLGVLPLSGLIAVVRSGVAADRASAPPRVELLGDGVRGHLLVQNFNGRDRDGLTVYGIGGDLYFSLPRPARAPDAAMPRR